MHNNVPFVNLLLCNRITVCQEKLKAMLFLIITHAVAGLLFCMHISKVQKLGLS